MKASGKSDSIYITKRNFDFEFFVSAPNENDYAALETGPLLTVSNNGSILIGAADHIHEGHYTCQANNGIGTGLSKVIFLRVNGKFEKINNFLSLAIFIFKC